MYYIRWKESERQKSLGYFRGFDSEDDFCWGNLKEAIAFRSVSEAEKHISEEYGWLRYVEFVFLHPLNFEARAKRNDYSR